MSLKHAILGFLSIKPITGYDLKKAFDHSVRHFWPANQSQIYRTLAQMTEEGLIEKEIVKREERLDMKIYAISEAGRAELHTWLATPLPERDVREPFLIQVFFGSTLSNEELLRLLAHEKQIAEEGLLTYEAVYQASIAQSGSATNVRAFYLRMLTIEYGIKSNRVLLEWLNAAIIRIQTDNYSLQENQ